MADIPGIRMEIEDEIDVANPTYKVKDLVAFLLSLDQESNIVWAGRDRQRLIISHPHYGNTMYICEAVGYPEPMQNH